MAERVCSSSKEYPAYYKPLSLRLYMLLEYATEASTEIRDLKVRTAKIDEILDSFHPLNKVVLNGRLMETTAIYKCGSNFEGTSLVAMSSDIDKLTVPNFIQVVTNIPDAKQHSICYLMVQDSDTPAGYVKLQLVVDGYPQNLRKHNPMNSDVSFIKTDNHDRVVYTVSHEELLPGAVPHGPARTDAESEFLLAHDHVLALRCRKWPYCASEWFSRRRRYNWPSTDLMNKLKTFDCFFVCVGHPLSKEADMQWRISFSMQERYLVSHFNSVQLKCFILLKLLKKEIINEVLQENSLTSYHCKTCMLYMIENRPQEFWVAENLLICLIECLEELCQYVEKGVCPNYFLPDENMFEGRLSEEKRDKLYRVLQWLLGSDFHYLLKLKTAGLGDALREMVMTGVERCSHSDVVIAVRRDILYKSANFVLANYRGQCKYVSSEPKHAFKQLHVLLSAIKTTERVTEHTKHETRKTLSLLSPFIEISLMSVLVVLAKRLQRSNDTILAMLTSPRWHQLSIESDSFTSKLKQASLLYATGHFDLSLNIVSTLKQNLKQQMSICGCEVESPSQTHPLRYMIDLLSLGVLGRKQFLQENLIPCVLFLPSEGDLIPPPLQYEKLSFDLGKTWYAGAGVDGKVLLHLLLYLNHQYFGMDKDCKDDIKNIKLLVRNDYCLSHRATALNVLGWIYKERKRFDKALACFKASTEIRTDNNTAKHQMEDIRQRLEHQMQDVRRRAFVRQRLEKMASLLIQKATEDI